MPEDVWERYQYIKKATEKNKGIFDYKAIPGKGAVVTIKFPAARVENKEADRTSIFYVPQGGIAMKKVLIVDDELEFTKDFAKALEMFGYEAYKAGDADSAFSVIENKKPDIVLCDYRLPDVDGDVILEKTKKNHPEIKFVMVTAYYDEVMEKRFWNLGADEVIFKPIVLTDVEALLAKL
jgi:CheY-like chemotaxis protein